MFLGRGGGDSPSDSAEARWGKGWERVRRMSERDGSIGWGKRLRVYVGLMMVSFGGALAAIVAGRLGDEALAVLAGAVCGVGAAIPTSLLILALVMGRRKTDREQSQPMSATPYPPVVVVAPPGGGHTLPRGWRTETASPYLFPLADAPADRPGGRRFTVVGGSVDDEGTIEDVDNVDRDWRWP